MNRNYFTFSVRKENLSIYLRRAIYPANLERNRAIANVKKGDVFWLWVREEKKLYGPFMALSRIFEDYTDIGVATDWPHRFTFRPWDQYIRVAEGPAVASLILLLKSFKTTTDITHLGRSLNPLLAEEGEALIRFSLSKSARHLPKEFDFGSISPPVLEELDLSTRLHDASEAIIEAYLLQNIDKLKELVGEFDEVYNQIFAGERYMDILCVSRSRFSGEITGVQVVEIKNSATHKEVAEGLEALSYYMFWCARTLISEKNGVTGLLLTPPPAQLKKDLFEEERSRISSKYEIDHQQIGWITYRLTNGTLKFEPVA